MDVQGEKRNHVVKYMEMETSAEVLTADKVSTFEDQYGTHQVWDVETEVEPFWVVTNPTNLYPKRLWPTTDDAVAYHTELMGKVKGPQGRS